MKLWNEQQKKLTDKSKLLSDTLNCVLSILYDHTVCAAIALHKFTM